MNSRTQHTIIKFDEKVQTEYNNLLSRRAEIQGQLNQCRNQINQVKVNLGAMVAENCDYGEYTDNLAELRLQVDALKQGIIYIDGQVTRLKAVHSWL